MINLNYLFIHDRSVVRLTLLLISILLFTLGASANNDEKRDPRQHFFTQSFGDLPEELQTAREDGKHGLLLFYESEGCPYCAAMMKNVLSQTRVQDWYSERFLNIAIDIHGDIEITDFDAISLPEKVFAEHRRVTMTPTLSFIDLDGNETYRHLGMVKTADEFLMMGKFIADKQYIHMTFKDYSKQHGL